MVSGSAGVGDHDRDQTEVGAVWAVGSRPTSMATPAIAKAVTCASRRANSSGVPSKADSESLSKMASDAWGELGHDLEPRRVAQERRDDVLDAILALPRHRHAQL
jgi:hypothetical protein